MKLSRSIIVGLSLFVGVACCPTSNSVIGVWECEYNLPSYGYNERVTITLQENMIFAFDSRMLNEDEELEDFTSYRKVGKYDLTDTLLRLNYTNGVSKEYGYEVKDGKLLLKNPGNGSVATYQRAQAQKEEVENE